MKMKCTFVLVVIVVVLFTLSHCLPANRRTQMSPEEMCRLPPKRGICRAYIERYYYDVKNANCKEFVYGGCYGNENSFESIEECMNTCEHIQ